jgi:putative transposase
LHAYVLMTNHVHLLLTPMKAQAVPKLVIFLGRRYVQYTNRSYRRTGTLWDSRYKSSLIQAETYLLTWYIELNPVRAAMVNDPAHYRRSSYRSNALGKADLRLTAHPLYEAMARGDKDRQAAYRALPVASGSSRDRRHPSGLESESTARQRALLREGREDDRGASRGQAKRAAAVGD